LRIAKSKEYLIEIKNRKDTIIRAKKTKTKSTKQNLFDSKYINTTIQVLCNSKNKDNSKILRDSKNRDRRDKIIFILATKTIVCNKHIQRQLTKFALFIVIASNTNI